MKSYTRIATDEKKIRIATNWLIDQKIKFGVKRKSAEDGTPQWEISVNIDSRRKLNMAFHAASG